MAWLDKLGKMHAVAIPEDMDIYDMDRNEAEEYIEKIDRDEQGVFATEQANIILPEQTDEEEA